MGKKFRCGNKNALIIYFCKYLSLYIIVYICILPYKYACVYFVIYAFYEWWSFFLKLIHKYEFLFIKAFFVRL